MNIFKTSIHDLAKRHAAMVTASVDELDIVLSAPDSGLVDESRHQLGVIRRAIASSFVPNISFNGMLSVPYSYRDSDAVAILPALRHTDYYLDDSFGQQTERQRTNTISYLLDKLGYSETQAEQLLSSAGNTAHEAVRITASTFAVTRAENRAGFDSTKAQHFKFWGRPVVLNPTDSFFSRIRSDSEAIALEAMVHEAGHADWRLTYPVDEGSSKDRRYLRSASELNSYTIQADYADVVKTVVGRAASRPYKHARSIADINQQYGTGDRYRPLTDEGLDKANKLILWYMLGLPLR